VQSYGFFLFRQKFSEVFCKKKQNQRQYAVIFWGYCFFCLPLLDIFKAGKTRERLTLTG